MGPSMLVSINSENLIFDAGRGVAARLVQAGVKITNYSYVFITHLHFDHTGGLADLLFSAWNKARNKTIRVYGPKGTQNMIEHFFQAYERDIWYRLSETELTQEQLIDIRNMVVVNDIEPGLVCEGSGWKVCATDVDHGHGLGLSRDEWNSLAYRIEHKGKSIVISGDAVKSSSLISIAKNADCLVMCCYLSGEEIVDHDTKIIAKYVLNSSIDAGKIANEASVAKITLVHIREKPMRLLDAMVNEIEKDYTGEIIMGEDLMEVCV
jgi:ribonuclease Z